MELAEYVEALRHSLTAVAAPGGEQPRETARLLADAMEPAVRLVLIDALSALAAEVTAGLDGDLVDIRVRSGDPEVVIVPAAHEPPAPQPAPAATDEDDGAVARISLRLPDALKTRAEAAAAAQGGSLNAWLVRAVADAVDRPGNGPSAGHPPGRVPRRYSGFARS